MICKMSMIQILKGLHMSSHSFPGNPMWNFQHHKGIPPEPRYNGPVYLPKHMNNMLSDNIKKELDKYNQEKKAQYMPNHSRMANVHDQEHEEDDDDPDHPEHDLENRFKKNLTPCKILTLRTFWKIITLYCKYGIHIPYF